MNNTTASPTVLSIVPGPGLVLVVLSCIFFSLWVLFLGFYYSRFSGIFLTHVISKLLISKDAYLKIGSVSVSVLSGKLMFRDVLYVTRDLTLRVVDGYAIFHWWQKFIPESEVDADKHPACRLTVSLNGFEFHVYNRSDLYDRLQDLYKKDRYGDAHNSTVHLTECHNQNPAEDDCHGKYQWRDLIPAIKFDINSGKLAFGNKMVETTLCLHFESAVALYKVAKPASFLDQFAHKITCDCKNFRVMLAPSNGYTGNRDDPPRYMGEGFVVLQTQVCKLVYLLDEPGIVPEINGNENITESDPCWNLDVTFIKSTSLSYGPWADRQREQLQKLFFPFDYQEQAVSKALAPGQRREHSGIDLRFDFKCDSTLDILFSKDQETQAVHLCLGIGSRVRIYQPWRVNEYGYMSSVVAELFQVETSTSLEFRQFVEAEQVKVTVNMTIPRVWNHTQHWSADISLYKASWHFVFAHKLFFQDLTSDWASKTAPELLTFIPYEWTLNISLKDFEMIWMANEYNWIDCSTIWQENMELAFCGESLDLSFILSYMNFLPEVEEIKFVIQVERLVGRLNIPESNTLRRSFISLAKEHDRRLSAHCSRSSTSATVDQEGPESADEQTPITSEDELSGGWRRHTEIKNGWVDVFSTPILSVIITYIYHPILPGETFESVRERYSSSANYSPEFPSDLEADVINLEIDANSCAFKLMGMVLKALGNIKENYFGAYQMYREFDARSLSKMKRTVTSQSDESDIHSNDVKEVDKLSLRPMEANIRVNLCSIKAELTKHCSVDEMFAPFLSTDRLTFEMHKNYSETRLQLQLTPTTIFTYDGIKRAEPNKHLSRGYLHLTGLQLRGHAMFSGEDRPIECETLEYAWLLELQLGTLCGKITLPQLQVLHNCVELFVFHLLDEENRMKDPITYKLCQHGALQTKCEKRLQSEKDLDIDECSRKVCPTEDDLKYKLTRVSVEEVDLFVVEAGCSCSVKVSPIRFASCNLHADNTKVGISFLVRKIEISQYVLLLSATKLKNQVGIPQDEACWLEAGSLHLGPVVSDVCLEQDKTSKTLDQKEFLEKHDQNNRCLWFLWKRKVSRAARAVEGRCGCTGGCNFFGKNVNGPRFFRGEKLDAAIQEEEEKLFGSPDGWQSGELDENDGAFLDDNDGNKGIYRHNSWAGRTRSPSQFGKLHSKGSGKYFRIRSETHSASSSGFDENKQNSMQGHGTISKQVKGRVIGSTTAWSVPESFQSLSSKIRIDHLKNTDSGSVEELQARLQRFPSDSSFYSCSSGLDKESALSKTPSLMSLDSFTSAVDINGQLVFENCEDFHKQFILLPSVLLSKYRDHLMQMQCTQWLEGEYLTQPNNKWFNVMHNLKAIDQMPRACPKRLEFTPQYSGNHNHTLLSRKYIDERYIDERAGVFSSGQVLPNRVEGKAGLREDSLPCEGDAGESDKMFGKMDTLKRKRWKTEINNESLQSTATLQPPTKPTLDEESLKLDSCSTVIVRIEGFVNIMASPLLLEAIQRYSKSVAERVKSLHPCTILDKIHVKSLDVSQKKYKMEQLLPDKESRLNMFLSLPGVNICFLQAFTRERNVTSVLQTPESSESDLSDTLHVNYHPNPSLSLLAIRVDEFSGQIVRQSQRNASYAKHTREKHEISTPIMSTQRIPQPPCVGSEKPEAEKVNSEVAGSFNVTQVQLQFSRLCNKSDVENSHTTAIPPKCSKVDFVYSKENVIPFSKSLDVKGLRREDVVIFVMLECGINGVSAKIGNSDVMKKSEKTKPRISTAPQKSGHSRSQSAPAQLLLNIAQGNVIDARPKAFQQTLHENYSEQVLESIVVEKQPGHTFPCLARDVESSISMSLSSQSDSTGNLTGNESEGEDEPDSRPLVGRLAAETGRIGKSLNPVKPNNEESKKSRYVLCHESDVIGHFTYIWFNCTSPSSVKPVPETYHLHNNLLTTGIPAVSSWMPGIEILRETITQLQDNYRQRYYSVTACMMAQGLPEKNKMLCKHNITSKASDESKYLQAGYSSQLIFHLRRHLVGARKHKLIAALSDEISIPSKEDLEKGIMALSRQWKCLLGVTDDEFIFRPAGSLKRPVVGRGVLTERDRAILLNTEKRKSQQDLEGSMGVDAGSVEVHSLSFSPGTQQYSASGRPSHQPSSSLSITTSDSENVPLSSEARKKRKKAYSKRDTEQSLYSWLSSTAASPTSSHHEDANLLDKQEPAVSQVTWAKNVKEEDDLFGQMVSQPTSGKQIADEKVIFRAFFLGMGFLQPSEEFSDCSDRTLSLLVKIRCLRLDISGGSLDYLRKKKAKLNIPTIISNDTQSNVPSFIFQNFETKINVKNSPSNKCSRNYGNHVKDKLPVDSTLSESSNASRVRSAIVKMSCHSTTQCINLSLIRLLLQVADMIDILGENYQGIKSARDSRSDILSNAKSGDGAEKLISDNQKCWRVMHQVSNLYSALPSRHSTLKGDQEDQLRECKVDIDSISSPKKRHLLSRTLSSPKDIRFVFNKQPRGPPKLKVVFVITLLKLKCITTLGELCLQTDINSVNLCACHKVEEHQGTLMKRSSAETCFREVVTTSVSSHLQKASLVLSETGQQGGTVVSCVLNTSHGIYSSIKKRDDEKRNILISLGVIDVDIPQHPVALHCMMTRSSKTLSKQLSEIQSQRSVVRTFSSLERSSLVEISREKGGSFLADGNISSQQVLKNGVDATDSGWTHMQDNYRSNTDSDLPNMSVTVVLNGFSVGASLLPSLKVEYKIGSVSSFGKTGKENVFKLDMPQHHLSFTSKVKSFDSSIPSSTSILLPRVDISGTFDRIRSDTSSEVKNAGGQKRKRHLTIGADIGTFNQNLSTDLLNHLIFIQRGFMKEVNDVLQRVSGESQPVPLWRSASTDNLGMEGKRAFLIFTFTLNLKGIQVTATTPSSTAIRLETGAVNLEVSNNEPLIREQNSNKEISDESKSKVLVKADVDLTLSLGQFLKDPISEVSDFQQLAFFKTQVGLSNSLQADKEKSEEKETLLISVFKPFIYVQPVAFDRAVLLYLNYKNAYSYWNEQRMSLTEDVQFATQAVFEKLPQPHPTAQFSGFLFLQLTVSELGICLPLYNVNQEQPLITSGGPGEVSSALVLTMEKMLLTCCSSASFVSKGNFAQFCVRFTDKFNVKKNDWKPQQTEGFLMNSCLVPNGTYEICSRTIREPYANDATKAGKMLMSLMWKMCGIDVHCDIEIGKRLKALGQTLTAVTGDSDIANLDSVAEEREGLPEEEFVIDNDVNDECFVDETDYKGKNQNDHPHEHLEKEMWKQARKVNELRRRPDVDRKYLESETEILQDLESDVFNEFRRDVKRKFEKKSRRPLFSTTDIRLPSPSRHVRNKSSTMRKRLVARNVSHCRDEVDFGDSNEMVNLSPVVNQDSLVSSRSAVDMPRHSQSKELKEMQTLSANVHATATSGLSPCMKRDRPLLTEIGEQEHVQQSLTNDHTSSFRSQRSTAVEQDLDFDLDVTVNIESGKCVFHPTTEPKVDAPEPCRPVGMRYHDPLKMTVSAGLRARQRAGMKQQDELPDSSVILLPGVEARVHYSSVSNSDNSVSFASTESATVAGVQCPQSPSTDSTISSKKIGKHASLYVSLLVQPLPKEMLIRPAILEFIDQALNPIVASSDPEPATADVRSVHSECDAEPATSSFVSSATSERSSFPVDIVIVARIQPSNIRISCIPISRVECLMRIPSLDLAYSSKSSPNKSLNRSCFRNLSSSDTLGSPSLSSFDSSTVRSFDSGGISFTICLSRFSLFIYHPYGKQHSVASKTSSAPADSHHVSPKAKVPQLISGKKDALSLSLEFIKFNLSRRRFGDVLTTNVRKDQEGSQDEISVESSTLVKVSGICDIGSATFTYDMRRLQEILDFPKCWHKRGLLSRLFLGKEGTYATKAAAVPTPDVTDEPVTPTPSVQVAPEKSATKPARSVLSGHRRNISTPIPGILPFFSSPSLFRTMSHSVEPDVKGAAKSKVCHQSEEDRVVDFDELDSAPNSSSTLNTTTPATKWETVVVLAISLSRLDVSTNMANVMGKTVWSTSDLRTSGNLRLTNSGERTFRSKLSVRQSTWESRGGIAAGHIELQDISSCVNVNELLGSEPEHFGNIRFRYCESRIDYMGTCILMGNISAFRISMADEWKTNITKSSSKDDLFKDSTSDTELTKATVFLRGNLHWKNVRLVICRSTTSDLIKMANKIEAFFSEQAKSSVMMLSSFGQPVVPGDAVSSLSNPLSQPVVEKIEKELNNDGLKYQHWSKVLGTISNLKSDVLSRPLPEKGAVVGGSLELTGWDVLLACFNGLNFRSQTWALFSISQPCATFSSKVVSVEKSCQVRRARSIQKLSFRLGSRCPSPKLNDTQETVHMGVICKVQRGRRNPPSMGSSVSEWLSYVSSVSDIPRQSGDSSPPPRPKSDSEAPMFSRRRNKSVSGAYKYEHESDAIFGLPSFKVDLTTEHDQPIRGHVPPGYKSSPSFPVTPSSPHIVECSLESCFYDSLYVTMDVGLLFFLHEIIQAYVKENESAATKTTTGPRCKDENDAAVDVTSDSDTTTTVGQRKKIRQFRNKSWKLEPTVRFLSWAGRRVDGVNIDWVLEKLGFSHARLTIPKWVQRGAMDPMDKLLSVLLHRLLLTIQENKRK